jgi:cobalamin biosynthesis Mg chelatase CobN
VVYRGAVAEAGAGVDETCRLPTAASGSTDSAGASATNTGTRSPTTTRATAGTSPSAPATASGRDEGAGAVSQQDDEARTGARGLAGFTAVAVVGVLLVVALRLRGR